MFSSKKREKEENKWKKMTSGNIFSIENQMQVMPLARNPKEKNEKQKKKGKTKERQKRFVC